MRFYRNASWETYYNEWDLIIGDDQLVAAKPTSIYEVPARVIETEDPTDSGGIALATVEPNSAGQPSFSLWILQSGPQVGYTGFVWQRSVLHHASGPCGELWADATPTGP